MTTITIDHTQEKSWNVAHMKYLNPARLIAMIRPETYVPGHIRTDVIDWVEQGVAGGFVEAVAAGDLKETFARADDVNSQHVRSIVSWFWNHAPSDCWGSPEKARAWALMHRERREAGLI